MPRLSGTAGSNLDPERVTFSEDEIHGLAPVLRLYLLGRSIPISPRGRAQLGTPLTVTLAFTVDPEGLPEQYRVRYGKRERVEPDEDGASSNEPIVVSVKMNRLDLLRRLAQGDTIETIFDQVRRLPENSTLRVYELAVRASVGG